MARERSAETLDELETLTRDLRRPVGAPAPPGPGMSASIMSSTDSSGSDSGVVDAAGGSELTPSTVRGFAQAYRERFGSGVAYEVAFFPDRIQVQAPLVDRKPRMERQRHPYTP